MSDIIHNMCEDVQAGRLEDARVTLNESFKIPDAYPNTAQAVLPLTQGEYVVLEPIREDNPIVLMEVTIPHM